MNSVTLFEDYLDPDTYEVIYKRGDTIPLDVWNNLPMWSDKHCDYLFK